MTDLISLREFGKLEEKVLNLHEMIRTVQVEQKDMRRETTDKQSALSHQVEEIKELVQQVKGGWWVFLKMAAVSGAITAAVMKWLVPLIQ